MELGGKSPNIIYADCCNLDAAIQASITTMFFNQGESCNAPSRVFVEASIYDRFIEQAMTIIPRFQLNDPLDETTVMGAILDNTQLGSILRHIDSGHREGARLLAGS